jgi:arabinofuranosyltransferase
MRLSHNISIVRLTSQSGFKYLAVILPILAGMSYLVGLWVVTGGAGFPLDDAWIHQTYARNLTLYKQWTFNPGVPSAGSTAPLWTLLLVPASKLPLQPFLWTYLIGLVFFSCLVWVGIQLAGRLYITPPKAKWILLAFLSMEYHLVWASVSGMETILGSMLILGVFLSLAQERIKYWLTGILIGCAVWVRPDLITLLGPTLVMLWFESPLKRRIKTGLIFLGALLLVLAPYLCFNWALSGSLLPNTFFAKQFEYRVLLQFPWYFRLLTVLTPCITGAGVILIPGFIHSVVEAIRNKNWLLISIVLWWIGFHVLYALRLPVIYQHGRYQIPAMPIYFIIGLMGSWNLLQKIKNQQWKFRLEFFTYSLVTIVLIGFFVLGMGAFANDVSIIESEMVAPAKWIGEFTPKESIIAAHDIGALGYFSDRRIVDLAGLVSIDVIPIIRDEMELAKWMKANQVTYLMTFPGWYEVLDIGQTVVYRSTSEIANKLGGENMNIYRWDYRFILNSP